MPIGTPASIAGGARTSRRKPATAATATVAGSAPATDRGAKGRRKQPPVSPPPSTDRPSQPQHQTREALGFTPFEHARHSGPGAGIPGTGELPLTYDETRIVAQVRDPHWAHAYWDISAATHEALRREYGAETIATASFVLRVYDVTDRVFDGANAHHHHDIQIVGGANSWYLQLGAPGRTFVIDLGMITGDGRFVVIARSNPVVTPRGTISDLVDERWLVVEEQFREIVRLSGGAQPCPTSSGDLVVHAEAGGPVGFDLSSGGVSSLASGGARAPLPNRDRDFWLTVNTELIVYGATEPDARVTIQGHPVELRPDGTFSARFALPDGRQVIPVVAVNRGGDEQRSVTPTVTRATE